MLKYLGISALAVAAFVVFMTAGSGRAAEPAPVAKATDTKGAATKQAAPTAAKDSAAPMAKETGAKPAVAEAAGKAEKTEKDPKNTKAASGEAKEAGKPASAEASGQRRAKAKRKGSANDDEPELPPGQGPPPPSPLSVNDLRQETNRERGPAGDFNAPPRVKLEQLLSEVGKARQSLHDDTLKLEALAGNDPSRAAEPTASDTAAAPGPGAPGQPAQKNPLDVLAKALRGIKPEQAGPIVARLDKGLAATVLLKMPPADAGKIMGALKPEVAAELATQIAMRAPSPQPGGKR